MTAGLPDLARSRDARAAIAQAGAQKLIATLARAAFAKLWDTLTRHPEIAPRDAIRAAQFEFGGAFTEAFAKAFGELLQRTVKTREVRALPIGGLSLSRRLYLHNVQTGAEVLGIVRQHAQGVLQARQLARDLYDGYNPRDGIRRPLEGSARATLPKALRALTADPEARRELTALTVRGQRQAARLRTAPLRAAYMEAFEAWKAGEGQDALRRRLEVAQREKNRFFAARIAQTELHRAHQAQVAAELMADAETTVVQVRINPAHPRTDICDLHARADLWGLGPGLYPKAEAPRPPYHPFCRCVLRSKPSLDAAGAARVPGGEAAYLRGLGPDQAARVMGSAERANRVLNGEPVEAIVNAGKDPQYRLVRVGDPVAQQAPIPPEPPAPAPAPASSPAPGGPGSHANPYDPAAPTVAPDVSTPARATAVAIEDQIRFDPLETAAFIDPGGAVLLRRQGNQNSVGFSPAELAVSRGTTLTHNHPGGSSFSVADVVLASMWGISEVRAVTPLFRQSISNLPKLPPPVIQAAYDLALRSVYAGVVDDVQAGALPAQHAWIETGHRAWQAVASAFRFTYWRERS